MDEYIFNLIKAVTDPPNASLPIEKQTDSL